MRISKEEVLYVANLARLDIDEAAVDKLTGQIGNILDYVDVRYGGYVYSWVDDPLIFVDRAGIVRGYVPYRLTDAEMDRALEKILR